jgi:hypothetical protein
MNKLSTIPNEVIMNKIYFIRGQKVMLDRDLAELYAVETKVLKQSVKRNMDRFPDDFMFEMTKEELENWRSQFVTSKSDAMGLRYSPFCFTEQGVAMLSSVLKSDRAIKMNIEIMRAFTRIRRMLTENTDLRLAIEKLERKSDNHSKNIEVLFSYLDELGDKKEDKTKEQKLRKYIGYKLPKRKK